MPDYNFRQYHYRSINAANEAERADINQELKALYDALTDAEKTVFNAQLQQFLTTEYGRLRTDYESINGADGLN